MHLVVVHSKSDHESPVSLPACQRLRPHQMINVSDCLSGRRWKQVLWIWLPLTGRLSSQRLHLDVSACYPSVSKSPPRLTCSVWVKNETLHSPQSFTSSSKREEKEIGLETCRFGSSAVAPCTYLNVTQPSEEKVISHRVTPLTVCSVLFLLQPPPLITDKQLDEREHTVEEWKGTVERAKPFCLPMLWRIHRALLNVCTMLHYKCTLLY